LGLAELCIRFSGAPTAVPALVKYMCREYVLDKGRYHDIRDKVANRMGEAQGDTTARVIWDACRARAWTELADFEQLPTSAQPEIESGLIELLADAFAATSDSGLHVLKASKNQWHSGVSKLPMFRRFAVKAGRRSTEVRTWLLAEAKRSSEDKILERIAEKLAPQIREYPDNPKTLLCEYLKHGDKKVYNDLRFLKDEYLFDCLSAQLSGRCSSSQLDLILNLLRGFQHRHRVRVVEVLLQHWSKISGHDYKTSADILAAYPVPPSLREGAIEALNRDLSGVHRVTARRALEQLLK
jgi:hypothetical protein